MFFFSSRRRHTRYWRDWSSDVCSSDLPIMQCNSEILPYKRVKGVSKEEKEKKQLQRIIILKNLVYCISALLVSRVLLLSEDNTTAPFGIALLIASVMQAERAVFPVSMGCIIGYISLSNKLTNLPQYL